MKIVLNGDSQSVRAATVLDALDELGFGGATVATALNGAFVPAGARAATMLAEGDHLEVVAPMQGG